MKLKSEAKKYFKNFSLKKITNLEKMFAKSITLRDWNIDVKGINNVIKANKRIFNDCKKINVKPLDLKVIKNTVFAEISITIDKKKLLVLDILEFNKKKKITSIKAFLGSKFPY